MTTITMLTLFSNMHVSMLSASGTFVLLFVLITNIKSLWSNFPFAALPRGRRVLVGNSESFQVRDHDFSTIFLIPTVILVNDTPERVDESWYREKACVGDPSTALQNPTEVANFLIEKFDTKEAVPPVLILYTDGGPEHRTTYLSVKIAMICLQKYLDLDKF